MRLIALMTAVLAVACGPSAAAPGRAEVLAFTHVTLIDGKGGAPRPDATVVVSAGRIVAVCPARARCAPRGARSLDLSGRWMTPGLIDTHAHLATFDRDHRTSTLLMRNVVMGGVTTVRDMGGNGPRLKEFAARYPAADGVAPRIVYSALIIGPASDFWMKDDKGAFVAGSAEARGKTPWFRRVRGPAEAKSVVAEAKRFGASALKLHSGLDAASVRALVAEAHKAGLKVWAHGEVTPAHPDDLVDAGVDAISHGDMIPFAGSPPPAVPGQSFGARTEAAMQATPVTSPAVAHLFERMAARGQAFEPTLFVIAGAVEGEQDPARKAHYQRRLDYAIAATRLAHAKGVPVLPGTDAVGGASPNLHSELQLLVYRCGFTPLEALSAATRVAARVLGLDREIGTVEPGKRADLVILTADPSADIRNTLAVEAVVLNGRYLKRDGPVRLPPLARAPG